MKTPHLESVEERVNEFLARLDVRLGNSGETGAKVFAESTLAEIGITLTTDRAHIAQVIEGRLEGEKADERKVAVFGEWQAETYEDKMLANAVLDHAITIVQETLGVSGNNK